MFDVLLTMAPKHSRLVDQPQLGVILMDVHEEVVNEVEVVTADNDQTASEDMPLPAANTADEEVSSITIITATTSTSVATSTAELTSSVATSTPPTYLHEIDLLVREVRALKERMADLLKRVQERLVQEESDAAAWAAVGAANQPLEIVNASPQAALQPSASNPAVKRKSTTSKYSKKRRITTPGGNTRLARSLNVKPTTTTVGTLNLATATYDDDEDEDFD